MREIQLIFNVKLNDLDFIRKNILENKGVFNKRVLEVKKFFDFKDKFYLNKGIFNEIKYSYDSRLLFDRGEYRISVINIDSLNYLVDRRKLIHQVVFDQSELTSKEEQLKKNGMNLILNLSKIVEEYYFGGILININSEIEVTNEEKKYFLDSAVQLSFEISKNSNNIELNGIKSNIESIFDNFFSKYKVNPTSKSDFFQTILI